MASKFRTWQQKIQQHPFIAMGIITLLITFLAFALTVHWWGWDWTGFTGYSPPTSQYQRGRTLWDWLQLLIIPILLAIGASRLNEIQKDREQRAINERAEREKRETEQRAKTEQEAADRRDKTERDIALDRQREDLLQTYLNHMSELLLKEKLRSAVLGAEVRYVARARTITVLTQLDARRIGYVFTFLREAGLMSTTSHDNVVSLREANLETVNWSHATLTNTLLSHTNLSHANLSHANLSYAHLSGTELIYADLSYALLWTANPSGAYLGGAYLTDANLSHANLSGAYLDGTHLSAADLSGANLSGADLSRANLSGAYLGGANLSETDLSGANLSGAGLGPGSDIMGQHLCEANLDKAILKGTRYNTEEILNTEMILTRRGSTTIVDKKILPTEWPQGFDPKAAGAIEDNTF